MDLSIIVLSYNTLELTKQCLESIVKTFKADPLKLELIVIDNASHDGSAEMLTEFKKHLTSPNIDVVLFLNKENVGYPKGNNQGIRVASGRYILLLNSDTIVDNIKFSPVLAYLDAHPDVGVLTVQVNLGSGGIDPASHRGFPTPWNSFCYVLKLEKLFGKVPLLGEIFGGYHQTYKDLSTVHEIDSPVGAFYLSPAAVLKKLDGFDETFFMYGEDLDLSYRIKKLGYKIIYYPLFSITHLKHQSGIKGKNKEVRTRTRQYFYESMKIFYTKHYQKKYPQWVKSLVFLFINFKQKNI